MIRNICRDEDCRGWDSNYPNNCARMTEITRCRRLILSRPVGKNKTMVREKKRYKYLGKQ